MNTEKRVESCLVVGAGIAGLLAARRLQASGLRVTLLDKGRRPGGRMATRQVGGGVCDHGAQFITVRDPAFGQLIADLRAAGIVREWARGFPSDQDSSRPDGNSRYCGASGMNGIAGHLAQGLRIYCSEQVTAISARDCGWQVKTESGSTWEVDALILTPPVPQSLVLLDAGKFVFSAPVREALERIVYDPCFAVMGLLGGRSNVPRPGGIRITAGPAASKIAWIADNTQKGISPEVTAVTIHTTPDFARQHWDAPHEDIARLIFDTAEPWLGTSVQSWQVHRWRYSQPSITYPEPCLFVDGAAPVVFAGDAFGGPKVEGAALSGWAAAESLLSYRREIM